MVTMQSERCATCRPCLLSEDALLSSLPSELLTAIMQQAKPRSFRRKQILFSMGHDAQLVFLVRRGLLKLSRSMADGHTQIFRLAAGREFVGFEALFAPAYSMTATWITAGAACSFPASFLRQALSRYPAFGLAMVEHFHRELEWTRGLIRDLSWNRARKRVVSFLLDLNRATMTAAAREDGHPMAQEDADRIDLSQHDIADLLGLSRETVCRTFAELRREGVIESKGHNFRVCDPSVLEALLEAPGRGC